MDIKYAKQTVTPVKVVLIRKIYTGVELTLGTLSNQA